MEDLSDSPGLEAAQLTLISTLFFWCGFMMNRYAPSRCDGRQSLMEGERSHKDQFGFPGERYWELRGSWVMITAAELGTQKVSESAFARTSFRSQFHVVTMACGENNRISSGRKVTCVEYVEIRAGRGGLERSCLICGRFEAVRRRIECEYY